MARDATEEKRIERVYAAEADRVGRVLETFYSLFLFFVRSPSLVAECPPDQMIPHARARRYGSCRLAFDTRGRGRVGCFPEKRKKRDWKYSIERESEGCWTERDGWVLSLLPLFPFLLCVFLDRLDFSFPFIVKFVLFSRIFELCRSKFVYNYLNRQIPACIFLFFVEDRYSKEKENKRENSLLLNEKERRRF